jgi:hypothetical protein
MDTLRIVSTNYNGQSAVITFYPDTGGTINLGTQVLPYDYVAPYFYGTYTLFFPSFGSTCTLYVEDTSGNFLLQENGDYIFQENYYKIIIESLPSPTPTPSITPSLSVTPSITPTRSVTPTPSITTSITPSRTPSVTPTPSITMSITPSRTPSVTPTPSITPSITPTRSVTPTPTLTPTSTSYGQSFIYYRWQITESKTTPPNANCVQSSEFVFQKNGVDQSMSGVVVTNPSGNNPVGEEPSKLIDGSLTTKALDLNFVTNGNVTNFIFQFPTGQSFDGYRWGTANDEESRDPKSWTISGSNDGVNWSLLHTVSGFNSTTTRNTYQTPQTYLPPAVSPTPTVTNTPTPTRTPSVTPTPSTSSIVNFVTDSLFMKLDATNYTSGTWSDETGNGNNATINGATWLSTDGGIFDLDGTNDTISVPHVSQLSLTTTGQKTVQVWVKFDALPSSGQQIPVFGKLSSASGFDGYWGGLFSNTGTVRCVTNGTGVQQISTSTLTITTNTWYLFTFISQITSTANTTKVYINNTEYITTAHGADSYGETNPFYLGWIGSGVSSLYLNGKIGACYFYTKGLNTTEISNNYNSTKSKYGL